MTRAEARARAAAAYHDATSGFSWEEIAERHGYPSAAAATKSVQRHACRYRWSWPVKYDHNRASDCYTARMRGASWAKAAKLVGYATANAALIDTRQWALRTGAVWPIPR